MHLPKSQKIGVKLSLLLMALFLFSGAWSCGSGGSTVSGQSTSVDEAGTDVSVCLSGPAIDYTSVFGGPCELHPGDSGSHTPSQTISYADLLFIANKESVDGSGQAVVDCVAKEAYCIGETQCLTVASICQFAVNCGADQNPCQDGTGACNANKVDDCHAITSKDTCNTSYQDKCFDDAGNYVPCENATKIDQHNCFWGVDHETNKTGCFSYGSGYGDSTCTPQ